MITADFWFIVLSLFVGVCFYDFIGDNLGFTFIDELLVLYLFVKWLIDGKENKEFVVFLSISFIYLFYGFLFGQNVWRAVLMDYFIEVKPFVAFYCSYSMRFRLNKEEQCLVRKLCMVLSILFLPIGIDCILGGKLVFTIFGHPSRYCTTYQILGLVYIIFSNHRKEYLKNGALIMALSLLGGRSKAYGFFALYLFMIYYPQLLKYRQLLNFKNVLMFIILVSLVLTVSWQKVSYYFFTGTQSDEMFARPLLYVTSLKILADYPLLGSGLGSYATFASSVYYSPIYYRYGISNAHGLTPENPGFICDTYFPIIAQFGLIGIILLFFFWKARIDYANKYRLRGDGFSFFITMLVFFFFIIEGVADSSFIQNRGVFIMFLLGIMHAKCSKGWKRKLNKIILLLHLRRTIMAESYNLKY